MRPLKEDIHHATVDTKNPPMTLKFYSTVIPKVHGTWGHAGLLASTVVRRTRDLGLVRLLIQGRVSPVGVRTDTACRGMNLRIR